MALPSSGEITLADVWTEYNGGATPGTNENISLGALSINTADGGGDPDAMSEFYGLSATPAIDTSEYFAVNTYIGNGTTSQIIPGGKIGTAASFNGSSSYINTNASLLASTTWSVSLWFNTDDKTNNQTIFSQYVSGDATRLFVWINNSGTQIRITLADSDYFNNFSITSNTWHHLVITKDSSGFNTYLDNGTPTFNANTASMASSTLDFRIGDNGGSSPFFDGELDQVRIFDKALSQQEVTTLYNETYDSSTKSTTDIFEDGSGIALYEFESGANDTGVAGSAIDAGQSAVFNGSSSTITLPLYNRGGNNNWSMSAWVYITGDITGTIFGFFDGSVAYEQHLIFAIYQGKLQVGQYGSVAYSANTITKNKWVHLAFTRNTSNSVKGYVDGVEVFSSTFAALNLKNETPYIGSNYNNASYFNGKIDDIRIYGDILTPTEVNYITDNDTGNIPSDNLLAHYKLDGNDNDETGNYNGTTEYNITYSDPAVSGQTSYNGTPNNVLFQGIGFESDFLWIKNRSTGSNHILQNTVDGINAPQYSDASYTGGANSVFGHVNSVSSNGFTVDDGGSTEVNANSNNHKFVAWAFKAAGSANTFNVIENETLSTSSTASGVSISTSGSNATPLGASINRDYGLGIIKNSVGSSYPQVIAHGYGSKPDMIITKPITTNEGWLVTVNKNIFGSTYDKQLSLNTSGQASDVTNSSRQITDVLTTLTYTPGNQTFITYMFKSVDGYQKVGSYTGTGASGNSVTTGFKPRFVMIKRTDSSGLWCLLDSVRGTTQFLSAEQSTAEQTISSAITFTSTSFTLTDTSANRNALNGTYLYLAIA